MIIVAITGPSMELALDQMAGSRRWADLFEFRLDLIQGHDIRRLLAATKKECVATLRPEWEGGSYRGTEAERLEILLDAVRAGVEYVDVELAAGWEFLRQIRSARDGVRIIISEHLSNLPAEWRESYKRLRLTGAEIIKWVFPVADVHEARPVIEFLRHARKERVKAVAIAMGEAGEFTRVLYRVFGGWGTYAAPERGPGAAPGQVSASLLRRVFRSDRLNGRTRLFGVVGNPLGQSKGIFVHNALFAAARLNAAYVRFPVRNLSGFLHIVMPEVEGCSVTIPFKEEVAAYCDVVDEPARRVGAVNTLYRRRGSLHGTNTDAAAALDAIERRMKVRGRRLLVIGAGGAARAVALEGIARGGRVVVANRTLDRARRIVEGTTAEAVPLSSVAGIGYDLLANTTPVGMVPNAGGIPVPPEILRPGTVVFDAIYTPPETELLRRAAEAGATCVKGTEMFLLQGAEQYRLFTRRTPNLSFMRRALTASIGE